MAGPHLAWPEQRPFWLLGVDVTSQPRQYAHTLEGRGFVYQPNLIWGNKPITIGHQYSTVALLPKEDSQSPVPWVVPLACQRVKLAENKAQVGAEQIGALLEDEDLPFHGQLTVEVATATIRRRSTWLKTACMITWSAWCAAGATAFSIVWTIVRQKKPAA